MTPDDENMNSLLEMFAERNREPLIVQAYLKDVREGDKRIILIDGEPVGATNRVPLEGEARSNMHVGGQAKKARSDQARTRHLRRHRPSPQETRDDLRRH